MAPSFLHSFLYEFVTLFVILDPVATVPIFITATAGLDRKRSLAVAAASLGISFLVLLVFIAGGQLLLEALHIPMASFQLAGSLVLLLFGLKMVLGQVYEEVQAMPPTASVYERAVYPLAIPGIAGPGSILTVVLLTDNNARTFAEQASTTGVLALCLVCFFGLYAVSTFIFRMLGPPGIQIVSRAFGLIVSSIAVHGLVVAIKLSFNLPA